MVVRISTIDEVRDMLIKLNISERDVHKVLSSLQLRDNWLQYLSQKIDDTSIDHEAIDDNLDTMIRQHSDPSSPSGGGQHRLAGVDDDAAGQAAEEEGFIGEQYVAAAVGPDDDDDTSVHRRETHICNTLGPNPKVMIAHMGTDTTLLREPIGSVKHQSTSSVSSQTHEIPNTITESRVEDNENSEPVGGDDDDAAFGSEQGSSSESSSGSSLRLAAGEDDLPPILAKDLSSTDEIVPKVYTITEALAAPNPKLCTAVMTAAMQQKATPWSGLVFFSESCALRATAKMS